MESLRFILAPVVGAILLACPALSQSVVRVADLDFAAPEPDLDRVVWLNTRVGPSLVPRVAVEGVPAFLGSPEGINGINHGALLDVDVALRGALPEGPLRGTFFLSDPDGRSMAAHPFVIHPGDVETDAERHRAAIAAHYDMLAGTDLPGAPWFRRQAMAHGSDLSGVSRWGMRPGYEAGDAFAMFTGGRALAENLRLDDVIAFEEDGGEVVPIADVQGITVPEMSFESVLARDWPRFDSLAGAIPEDQFAVFFPSFGGLLRVVDELQADAAPLVQLVDRRAEQSLVRDRYERQLCLELDGLVRALGAKVVKEVAFTGSDPYMRTGTDVAIVLEGNPLVIRPMIASRQLAAAKELGIEPRRLKVAGWDAIAVETPDRRVSSWLAATDSLVVVSNGQGQLRRVLETLDGTRASLAGTEEYRWFRQRYAHGGSGEDAFAVVSDAAIRRWSGPHARVATARRVKAAAQLADADAWRIAEAHGLLAGEEPEAESIVEGGGEIELGEAFARDSVYGTREFLTPVAELVIDTVTAAERRGYDRWRGAFERSWGGAFDPIASRFDVREDGLSVDMTLVPLIVNSDYGFLLDLVGRERLSAASVAPHAESLVHFVAALDRDGPLFEQVAPALPVAGLGDDGPLGWMGDHVSFWLEEDDEYFERIRETDSMETFLDESLPGLPVGLGIAVDSPLGAVSFIAAMRTFLDEIVPGMLRFDSTAHGGREYVGMSFVSDIGFGETPTLYYVLVPEGLVFSFSRRVIERAIDRAGTERPTVDWSDRGVSLQVRGEVRELADVEWLDIASKDQLLARSWGNLAILNEWKRLGAEDPVRFHEEQWGTRLVCPGGGEYVWNAAHQTMESSVFGHPAAPKEGPLLPPALDALKALDLGLAFERFPIAPGAEEEGDGRRRRRTFVDGLRAFVHLKRAAR